MMHMKNGKKNRLNLAKVISYIFCWIMLMLILVFGTFFDAYKISDGSSEKGYSFYELNKVLLIDANEIVEDKKSEIDDIVSHLEELEEFKNPSYLLEKEKGIIREELNVLEKEVEFIGKIHKVNIVLCIVCIMLLMLYLYNLIEAFDSKKKVMISGILFSLICFAEIIMNRIILIKISSIVDERYGEVGSVTTTVIAGLLVIYAIINVISSVVVGGVSAKLMKNRISESTNRKFR